MICFHMCIFLVSQYYKQVVSSFYPSLCVARSHSFLHTYNSECDLKTCKAELAICTCIDPKKQHTLKAHTQTAPWICSVGAAKLHSKGSLTLQCRYTHYTSQPFYAFDPCIMNSLYESRFTSKADCILAVHARRDRHDILSCFF